MTTTTDQRAMLRAIAVDPADDTVRLAFADSLQENPLPAVKCEPCAGTRRVDRRDHNGALRSKTCPNCFRTDGTVPDDLHERWAELIRIQIEAIPLDRTVTSGIFAPGPPRDTGNEFGRLCDLRKREREILPALRARLMPRCPPEPQGCNGKLTPQSQAHCNLCKNSGVCPGTLVRGMPVCEVPLAAVGRESHSGTDVTGTTSPWRWLSTHWAIAAKAAGASFRPSDLEPLESQGDGRGFYWSNTHPDGWQVKHRIAAVIWNKLEWWSNRVDGSFAYYPTESAALLALERAVTSLVPATTPEEQP